MPPQLVEGFDFDFESSFADYYGKIKEAPQAKNCNIRIYFLPEIGKKGFIGGLHFYKNLFYKNHEGEIDSKLSIFFKNHAEARLLWQLKYSLNLW